MRKTNLIQYENGKKGNLNSNKFNSQIIINQSKNNEIIPKKTKNREFTHFNGNNNDKLDNIMDQYKKVNYRNRVNRKYYFGVSLS